MMDEREKNQIQGGTLYLVSTPIGNLSDITERALKVLAEVDFVAAEDTRNSGMLLARFGISKPMISYFEHNKREHGKVIIERLLAGESCALVTDAGTPAISDPGEDLVKECAAAGIPVVPVPGACAAITALSVSGLPTGRFVFEGFLPTQRAERNRRIDSLRTEARTIIFYEAPHRLRATLSELSKEFGNRRVTLCRELTKLNEEVMRTTLSEAVSYYETFEPRGEYVLVVEGAPEDDQQDPSAYPEDPAEHVEYLMLEGLERMSAIKKAAKQRGLTKGTFYKMLIGEQKENETDGESTSSES